MSSRALSSGAIDLSPQFDPNQQELDLGIPTLHEHRQDLVRKKVRGSLGKDIFPEMLASSHLSTEVLRHLPRLVGVNSLRDDDIVGKYSGENGHPTAHILMDRKKDYVRDTTIHEIAHHIDRVPRSLLSYRPNVERNLPPKTSWENYPSGGPVRRTSREGFATGVEAAHRYAAQGTPVEEIANGYDEAGYWSPEDLKEYSAGRAQGLLGRRSRVERRRDQPNQFRLF
jgi:hypothetical protein